LSHRYGARTIPTRILSDEYLKLKNEINSNLTAYDLKFEYKIVSDEENKSENQPTKSIELNIDNLFETCYEFDVNEIPSRFKLKYLDKIFANYDPKDPLFEKVWSKLERKLGNILRKAAESCLEKGNFNRTQYDRFFVSGI
jgi:hypothetical protein